MESREAVSTSTRNRRTRENFEVGSGTLIFLSRAPIAKERSGFSQYELSGCDVSDEFRFPTRAIGERAASAPPFRVGSRTFRIASFAGAPGGSAAELSAGHPECQGQHLPGNPPLEFGGRPDGSTAKLRCGVRAAARTVARWRDRIFPSPRCVRSL